jgi:hypothetical protein
VLSLLGQGIAIEDFVEGGRSLGWINLIDSLTVPNEVEIVDCGDQIEEEEDEPISPPMTREREREAWSILRR